MARRQRSYGKQQQVLDLEHYLDEHKPGALAGSKPLEQWCRGGRWPASFDFGEAPKVSAAQIGELAGGGYPRGRDLMIIDGIGGHVHPRGKRNGFLDWDFPGLQHVW